MANSGSEQFWRLILPARRPETESIATGTESMATAAESITITAESTATAAEIDRGRHGPGQSAPGEPSLTRSCASTAGGTREATLPP